MNDLFEDEGPKGTYVLPDSIPQTLLLISMGQELLLILFCKCHN